MAIQTLIDLFIQIFIMIGVGYFLRRRGVVDSQIKSGVNKLLLQVVLPFNILASANRAYSAEVSQSLLVTAVFSAVYYLASILGGILIGRAVRLEGSRRKVFVTMTAFANVGFLGLPLTEALFGGEGVLIAVIYNLFYNVLFYTFAVNYLGKEGRVSIWEVLKNPVAVVSLAAVVIYLSPFRFPEAVAGAFSSIGAAMTPLSMITVGCSLAEVDVLQVVRNKYAYLVSALRLAVYPLAAFAVLRLFQVEGLTAAVCVMLTGMPSATTNVIASEQYGCAPEFATEAVVQGMIFMIVTLPLLMMLVGNWV